MKFQDKTKSGLEVLEIVELQKANDEWRYVAVIKGINSPIIYNKNGVSDEANYMRDDDDLNLVQK